MPLPSERTFSPARSRTTTSAVVSAEIAPGPGRPRGPTGCPGSTSGGSGGGCGLGAPPCAPYCDSRARAPALARGDQAGRPLRGGRRPRDERQHDRGDGGQDEAAHGSAPEGRRVSRLAAARTALGARCAGRVRPLRPLLAAALVVGYAAVAGCSRGRDRLPHRRATALPGQADHTRATPSEPGSSAAAAPDWNHDDVSGPADDASPPRPGPDLAELAMTGAADPRVRALATRSRRSRPEVWLMAGWLAERDRRTVARRDPLKYDHYEHEHHSMGLLTDD